MAITFDSRTIDIVAQRELLPTAINNHLNADHLYNWKFSGLQPELQHTDLVGTVTARRRDNNFVCSYRFRISQNTLMYNSGTQHMLLMLRQHIEYAVSKIITNNPKHKPGALCVKNKFCEECYA